MYWVKTFFYIFAIGSILSACSTNKILRHGAIGTDKSLYYTHKGKGEAILFVHGGPGLNHRYFLPFMDTLSKNYHLIYYDQRACGDSEIPTDTNAMRITKFVEDIHQLKEKFKLKKFHLVAHSWGSILGIKYAAQYSSNVLSLTLINPASISSEDQRQASRVLNQRFDYNAQLKRSQIVESAAFKEGSPIAMSELIKLSFANNMAHPALADQLNIYLPIDYSKKQGSLKYLFKDLSNYDYYPEISKITCPSLIITGEKDAAAFVLDKIKSELPGAEYHIFKNCGHFPFLESPDEFFSTLLKFYSKLQNEK